MILIQLAGHDRCARAGTRYPVGTGTGGEEGPVESKKVHTKWMEKAKGMFGDDDGDDDDDDDDDDDVT